jgi:hypothetical protein
VPTIAELLTAYRDRTGASYEEMARKVGDEINRSRMHQLVTAPPKEFPKRARTIELLAQLLEVPVTTVVLAFAAGLGIPVSTEQSRLALLLPARTDDLLTDEDRDAIIAMTRSLMAAHRVREVSSYGDGSRPLFFQQRPEGDQTARELRPPEPDLTRVAARRGESEGRQRRNHMDDIDPA